MVRVRVGLFDLLRRVLDAFDTLHMCGVAVRFGGPDNGPCYCGVDYAFEKQYRVVNWWSSRSGAGNGWERGKKRVPCRA